MNQRFSVIWLKKPHKGGSRPHPKQPAQLNDVLKQARHWKIFSLLMLGFSVVDAFWSRKLKTACFSCGSERAKVSAIRRYREITLEIWIWYWLSPFVCSSNSMLRRFCASLISCNFLSCASLVILRDVPSACRVHNIVVYWTVSHMRKPKALFLIALHGHAGVGKSTLAEYLGTQLSDTAHISVDRVKRFISELADWTAA